MDKRIDFFAASNSASGFVSLFESLYSAEEGDRVWLISGGPGSGKSTLCRRVAQASEGAGRLTEYIHCSSDPDSLDGVIAEGRVLLDATPPHTVRPMAMGAVENLVDVGACWNSAMLRDNRTPILALSAKISRQYGAVYRELEKAGEAVAAVSRFGLAALRCRRLERYYAGLIHRCLPAGETAARGQIHRRFLSGITPQGTVFYDHTVTALADKVYLIRDPYRAAAPIIIRKLAEAASAAGLTAYLCFCPLRPHVCEHLILPELSLAFVTDNEAHGWREEGAAIIRCSRFYRREAVAVFGKAAQSDCHVAAAWVRAACRRLEGIKKLHDELEQFYVPAMDFSAVDRLARQTAKRFLDD